MDDPVREALANDLTVDITTTGRRTGLPRRIEIWLLSIDGRWFITGTPGPRAWLANLLADPRLTVHLKQAVHADLPATARPVTDEPTRRQVLAHAAATWYRGQSPLEELIADAPLVELTFAEETAGGFRRG
jgi:deazaflavin-dependent oxidoreductase (nitroreductase family)